MDVVVVEPLVGLEVVDVGFGIWRSEDRDFVAALRRDGFERSESEQRVDSGDDRLSELGVRSHRQ